MALNPNVFAAEITEAYKLAANLDSNLEPTGHPTLPNNFASAFSSAMNSLLSGGVVQGTLNTGANTSELENILNNLSNSESDVDAIGNAFASLMSNVCTTNGTPAHGGVSVVNVTNDASSKGTNIANIIKSEITDQRKSPPYQNLANAFISAIGIITWQVTERYSNGSTQTHNVSMV